MKVETPSVRGSWWASLLAGLPFILYALAKYGLYLSVDFRERLDRFYPLYHFARRTPIYGWLLNRYASADYWRPLWVAYQTTQWIFGILVVVLLLIGWRRGWPRWAAVWMGFFLVVVADNLIELGPSGVLGGGISLTAWLLLVGLALRWQARRDALKGFLTILPVMPMMFWWLGVDDIAGNESHYYLLIGILMALGVGVVVRHGTMKVALGVLLPLILVIGLGVSFGTVYHGTVYYGTIPPYQEPSVWRVITSTSMEMLFLGFFTSPLWVPFLGKVIRKKAVSA